MFHSDKDSSVLDNVLGTPNMGVWQVGRDGITR
jgi:hypothetical protein